MTAKFIKVLKEFFLCRTIEPGKIFLTSNTKDDYEISQTIKAGTTLEFFASPDANLTMYYTEVGNILQIYQSDMNRLREEEAIEELKDE